MAAIATEPTRRAVPTAVTVIRPKIRAKVDVRCGFGAGWRGADGRRVLVVGVGVAICSAMGTSHLLDSGRVRLLLRSARGAQS